MSSDWASVGEKKNPGSSGGKKTRGRGYCRGGPEENRMPLVHLVHSHQANFAKLFIGEEGLFLIAGALGVP